MINLLNEKNVKRYEETYARGTDHNYPNENVARLVKWYFDKGGKVLDYGFGYGENLIHLLKSGYNCSGIEVSKNAKSLVEKKLQKFPEYSENVELHILEKDQTTLPFKDNEFDYILSNQVIYFLAAEHKIVALLNEFKRILKSSGKIIITMMSRLNHYCIKGSEIEPNVYEYVDKKNKYKNYAYIIRDEGHARELFSIYNIHEIGWFDNYYCGASGHHYVILASNTE